MAAAVSDDTETTPAETPAAVAPLDPESTTLEHLEPDLLENPPFRGALAIRPGQPKLTAEQEAAFAAIVNFPVTNKDPWFRANRDLVIANINVFLHVCQARQLDPWARQIYLIKRGTDNKPTFTIQTGIEGYRYMAERTRRALGPAKILWTGTDDDDKSWREVTDPHTGLTYMDRNWWNGWPKSRDHPGMARGVQPYRTLNGDIARADVIAHWDMFAPMFPDSKWEKGQKIYLKNPDGTQQMKLGDMWARDAGAHLLGKCSEAFAIRQAFPQAVAGIFVNEEMHQADAAAERDVEAERLQKIQDARAAHEGQQGEDERPRETIRLKAMPDDETEAGAGDVAAEPAPQTEQVSDEQRRQWLLEELKLYVELRQGELEPMLQFVCHRLDCADLGRAPVADLQTLVAGLRSNAVQALIEAGRVDEAEVYAQVPASVALPVERLLGSQPPAEPVAEPADDGQAAGEPEVEPAEPAAQDTGSQ